MLAVLPVVTNDGTAELGQFGIDAVLDSFPMLKIPFSHRTTNLRIENAGTVAQPSRCHDLDGRTSVAAAITLPVFGRALLPLQVGFAYPLRGAVGILAQAFAQLCV